MSKSLNPKYIEALLTGNSISGVKLQIRNDYEKLGHQNDLEYAGAMFLKNALSLPEDSPDHQAARAFLEVLKASQEQA